MFAIRRRNAWRSSEELEEAAGRASRVGDDMTDDIRWIRRYVLEEGDGSFGRCASIKRQVRGRYANTRREQICQPMRSLASATRWWFGLTQNRPPLS